MKKLISCFVIIAGLPGLFACSFTVTSADSSSMPMKPLLKISHSVRSASNYYELGRHFQKNLQFEKAVDAYNNVLEMEYGHIDARNALGVVYANQGRFPEAIAEFDIAIKIAPNEAVTYNNRGHVYYLQHNYEQALIALEKALTLDPGNIRAYNNLGAVYLKSGQVEKFRQLYSRIQRLDKIPEKGDNPANNSSTSNYVLLGSESKQVANLDVPNQSVAASLRSVEADASLILHGPDDLLLKVDSDLHTVPKSGVLQWKTVQLQDERSHQYSITPLQLKPTRRFTAPLENSGLSLSKIATSLDTADLRASSTVSNNRDALMLKVESEIAALPIPGALRWHTVTTQFPATDSLETTLRLKMSMPLAQWPDKKFKTSLSKIVTFGISTFADSGNSRYEKYDRQVVQSKS